MKTNNECYTYFRITGDFEPEEITSILGLKPSNIWRKTDIRRDGKPYGFANWEYGYARKYDPYVYKQMEQTIEHLEPRVKKINYIRENFDVDLYLVVVPHVYAGEISPALAPSQRVVDFCHDTKVQIDIDLYVYNEE